MIPFMHRNGQKAAQKADLLHSNLFCFSAMGFEKLFAPYLPDYDSIICNPFRSIILALPHPQKTPGSWKQHCVKLQKEAFCRTIFNWHRKR
jgi:hypothetical protein